MTIMEYLIPQSPLARCHAVLCKANISFICLTDATSDLKVNHRIHQFLTKSKSCPLQRNNFVWNYILVSELVVSTTFTVGVYRSFFAKDWSVAALTTSALPILSLCFLSFYHLYPISIINTSDLTSHSIS